MATLSNPGTLTAYSFNTFTAQTVITLAESTTYWITVNEGISSDRVFVSSKPEDGEISEWGWSVGDGSLDRTSETADWSPSTYSLMIRIRGTISTDATLSGLTLEGTDGDEAITLSPAFDDDTETYTASVVNRIDAVKLTATKNDDNAMVVITNDDDQTSSPEEAVLDLSVGSNTLTVTVTAQNGTATRTYTITVERHTADTLISNTHLSATSLSNWIQAQSFETGANLDGYTVSEVDIRLGHVSGTSTSVKIRKNNADNEPGDLVATLTNPGTLTENSLNTFTAPDVITLDANTTYWITVNEGISSNSAEFALTNSDDETGETGWIIGDGYLFRFDETQRWDPYSNSLLMTIKGTAIPTISLVSNTHLSTTESSIAFQAQSFETGTNEGGYTVSRVEILLGDVSGASTTVKIRKNNADNEPGDLEATLTNPGTLTSYQFNTFTAPAGTTLAASTTYWISVNEGISFSIDRASVHADAGNDQTGETGWSIGDDRLFRNNETNDWSTSTSSLLMTIKGTVVPCDGIWCATLTVQGLGSFDKGCDNTQDSTKHCSVLLDPSNTFSHAGVNYTIEKVRDQNGSGNLEIWVTPDIATGSENLVFHVDDDSYAFQDADQKAGEYRKWEGINYPWGTGNEVSLKLTEGLTNAMGNPTISGVPQVDMMLTVVTSAIDDVDGLPATFTYQWVRVATDKRRRMSALTTPTRCRPRTWTARSGWT